MAAITRKLDERKRDTPFIQAVRSIERRRLLSHPLQAIATSHAKVTGNQRAWRSFDSRHGVILVTNLSDLPTTRATAERILGVPVKAIHADISGTVYAPKGL